MADDKELADATAPLSFAEFLERMKDPAAADLVRSIKNFIKTFDERKSEPERDSQFVQQFLAKSEGAFRHHPVWASGPAEHQAQAIEGLEKYLMTKIYHKTFAVSALDRERDEALSVRMAALNFIKPQHLDIPRAFQDEKSWLLAMKELHKINSYKAPRDKLVCILNCCRIINNLLHVTVQQGQARGADDFLPILIYVVIHANPPQLASNLEYIQRFRMQSRMVSESSYFFTQLYSAASFIETITTNSLTMDADEFVARMVAAGVPDMQLLPASTSPKNSVRQPETPSRQAQPEPPSGHANGIAEPQKEAPAPQRKASAGQEGPGLLTAARLDPQGKAKRAGSPKDAPAAGPPLPSVSQLEQAGVQHVVDAEAAGQLQSRHPYIYASAADLRVADVEALLTAYKQLVLRYEALSLALSHSSPAGPSFADPPPAVDGPNPFASGGGFGSVMSSVQPTPATEPSGRPATIPAADLVQRMHVAPDLRAAHVRPAGRQPALLAEDTASVLTLASGISGIASALPSQQARASQEMLTSASLTVPIQVPTPQPTLTPISSTSPPLSEVPPPGKAAAAAAAAAAIDSVASGHSRSASGAAEPLRALSDKMLSISQEDTVSPSELRRGLRAAIPSGLPDGRSPRGAVTPTGKLRSARSEHEAARLASHSSEVQMPRPPIFSPFGDPPSAKEVEMPKVAMPNPFYDNAASYDPPTAQDASPPLATAAMSPMDQPADEGVTLPDRGVPSPFLEQEDSASFPRAMASPFTDDQPASEQGWLSSSQPAGASPRSPQQSPGGTAERSYSSGERAKGNLLTGFANSPFAASAGDNFTESPTQPLLTAARSGAHEKSQPANKTKRPWHEPIL